MHAHRQYGLVIQSKALETEHGHTSFQISAIITPQNRVVNSKFWIFSVLYILQQGADASGVFGALVSQI